jgi:phage-related protein
MIQTGVNFGEIHSYYDLGLILSAVDIPAAVPKTNYIDIPGGDGSLDLSEVHGDIKYNDRECAFTFTVAQSIRESEWEERKTLVCNALNGRTFNITLDKDPDYYYTGRCTIDGYSVEKRLRQIVVKAKVKPWKYKQTVTALSFPLSADVQQIEIINARKKVCPVIECTHDNTIVQFAGTEYHLSTGAHKVLDIQLAEGSNTLYISGSGSVKFTWQEADL